MAEAVGVAASLVSLASLFGTCIECFGYYQAAKDCPRQIKTKLVKLDFEKTRLLIWANQVGLVSTHSPSRSPGLERHEARLRETFEQIRLLLAEANEVKDKYGIIQHEGPTEVVDSTTNLISRNSFATFLSSYRRFRGRYFEPTSVPKLTRRIRWAIQDETKFEGLIKVLKDFVDNLFWLIEVERRIVDHIVEEDIMAVADISELEMIRDASEHEYQVWSDVASRVVERTERGTVAHTDLHELETHDGEAEQSPRSLDWTEGSVVDEFYYQYEWEDYFPPACFVLTDSCVSYSDPPPCCDRGQSHGPSLIFSAFDSYKAYSFNYEAKYQYFRNHSYYRWDQPGDYTLGKKLYSQFRIGSSGREAVKEMQIKRADGEGQFSGLATAYVYIAPCDRLLCHALGVCWEANTTQFFHVRIRIDDRLSATCCQHGLARDRFVSILDKVRGETKETYWTRYIDQMWLEQRIYELEEEKVHFQAGPKQAARFRFLYREESYPLLETVAAIILIGEETQLREVMTSKSIPKHPRVPSATEIYAICQTNSYPLRRNYLGTYVRNPSLVKRKEMDLEIAPGLAWSHTNSAANLAMPVILKHTEQQEIGTDIEQVISDHVPSRV